MSIRVIPRLKINQNTPDFHLEATSGQTISIGQFRQRKNVVIYFFGGITCKDCANKLHEFSDEYNRLEHLNAQLFAISHDTIKNLKSLKKELDLPFELLSDPDLQAANAYAGLKPDNSEVNPSIFVIDKYNSLYSQWLELNEQDLPPVLSILRSLHAIEIECPECGYFPGATSI